MVWHRPVYKPASIKTMRGETIVDRRHDVVVVGAGIAGLYCSLHLKDKKNVGLYEASSRLGGRIETWRIDPKAADDHEFAPICVSKLRDEDVGSVAKEDRSKFFVAEFGPMRIEPEHQPYLAKLLSDLEILEGRAGERWSDLVPFPPYRSEPPTEPKFTLEGEEAAQTTLIDLLLLAFRRVCEAMSFDGVINEAPWELTTGGESVPYHDANFFWRDFRSDNYLRRQYWKRSLRQWINLLNEDHYQCVRQRAMFRGIRLRDMGFWNLLGSVLSHMATVKLRDWASFYHLLPENPSAAEWFIFWLRAIKSTDSLRGIRGGMDWIVHTLCREKLGLAEIEFQETADHIYPIYKDHRAQSDTTGPGVKLFLRKKLVKVQEVMGEDPHILLTFQGTPNDTGETELDAVSRTETVRADHVILAIPKIGLQEIQFALSGAVSAAETENKNRQVGETLDVLFDSVAAVALLKCFFILKNPFWEDDRPASRYAYTTPTRELHYQKNDDNTRGMIMIYTDRPGTQFWSDYLVDDLKVDLGQSGLPGADFQSIKRHQPNAQVWKWEEQSDVPGWQSRKFAKNDRLLRTFLSYAREEGADSTTADRVLVAGMHDWGLRPYEGACHAWRPGSDPAAVMSYFHAFSLSSTAEKRLHICGEAYSDYQGFIEGALRSAANVLENVFGIDRTVLQNPSNRRLVNTVRVPPEELARLKELSQKPANDIAVTQVTPPQPDPTASPSQQSPPDTQRAAE
jgi:monoamine oxidase